MLGCWGGLVLIFLINEFRFAWDNPYYSLMESLTKSQSYYTAKFTMPILFWGVWLVLKDANHYGLVFITQLQRFLTINAILIIAAAIFGITCFESYPLSGRWGYSGLLWHLSFHSIAYGVFMLYLLDQKRKRWAPLFCLAWCYYCLAKKRGCCAILILRWGSSYKTLFTMGDHFKLLGYCFFSSALASICYQIVFILGKRVQ